MNNERGEKAVGSTPHGGIVKGLTGIEGFDDIAQGGLPRGRLTLVTGDTGAGKTIFALQTLVNGARQYDEPGILVAFEEDAQQIVRNARSMAWQIDGLLPERIQLHNARPDLEVIQAGQFDLEGLLAALTARVTATNAKRIVFDGIDSLLWLMDDQPRERNQLIRVQEWLRQHDLVGILTAKSSAGSDPTNQRFDYLPFLVDCIVHLRHEANRLAVMRTLRIVKYRGTGYSENETPLIITSDGIDVAGPDLQRFEVRVSSERISTGIPQLDSMLSGGYLRGSSTLITGTPGTAKSTLAAHFCAAAGARGERTLYVSFDETGPEIVRNMRSIGLELEPMVSDGRIVFSSPRVENRNVEAHLLELRRLIRVYEAENLVIDPISALLKVADDAESMRMTERLLSITKERMINALFTSLVHQREPSEEAARLPISTLADTWLHVAYHNMGGERNRTISILKARGTGHSNQVRELLLHDAGVELADVYTAGGEVLLGTLRYEKEQAETQRRRETSREYAERKRMLALREAELRLKIENLQLQLASQQAELQELAGEDTERLEHQSGQDEAVRRRRTTGDR